MERENQHHHLESQDEQQELSHEHAEVEHETRHEHRHHGGGLLKRSRLISGKYFDISRLYLEVDRQPQLNNTTLADP